METEDVHTEEISDSDSGIILNSGPDSPTSRVKELSTHTRAMRLKHQALEERLEMCLLELRTLCIREAELTGKLSSDFPLLADEKPPRFRRRVGATFKLDDSLIQQGGENSELHSLEADLALQLQIFEAARRLLMEENLSKPQKKSRLQQCKREERKVKDLQEAVFQHRIKKECSSPPTNKKKNSTKKLDLCMSDDSSLSDAVALDYDVDSGSLSPSVSADQLLQSSSENSLQHISGCGVEQTQGSNGGSSCSVEHPERSPIQNSPWRESSLDQPYLKPNKPVSASSSRCSSPIGIPVFPSDSKVLPFKNLALRHGLTHSCSAPSTPEMHVRRQYSQSFRLPRSKPAPDPGEGRGRTRLPRRRPEFTVGSPQFSPQGRYLSSSEDSSSEHSAPSYTSSPGRDGDHLQDAESPAPTQIPKLCPPPYGFHYGALCPSSQVVQPSSSPVGFYKDNNQQQSSPMLGRRPGEEGPCSPLPPQCLDSSLGRALYLSPSRAPQPQQEGQGPQSSSTRRVLKPPPPYTRLVRTPSLREYPNHAARVLPREMVSEELKSWHRRNQFQNQFQRPRPCSLERHGSFRIKSPTSPHLPPYIQGPHQTVILQRAADGTPVQWFEEEDSEIVSQV